MDKREYYLSILSRIDSMLTFAETKISFMLAYLGLLLAVLGNQTEEIKYLLQKTSQEIITSTLALLISIIVVILFILYYMGKVLLPKLKFSKRNSMIYFSDISKLSENKYRTDMARLKVGEIEEDLLSQIHAVSSITSDKFKNIHKATIFLGILTVLWLVIIVEIIVFSA
ncbi:MAG: hypothetical protein UZ14_CFX002000741 [Chloroflexi bacterium OLB14]|nr:MAG: hypothetical protein UZ14_CFX002000741 [Chloroflexi bacterium OLB14]